jgi:hypothetical protein
VRVYAKCVPHDFSTVFNAIKSAQGVAVARLLRIPTLPAGRGNELSRIGGVRLPKMSRKPRYTIADIALQRAVVARRIGHHSSNFRESVA